MAARNDAISRWAIGGYSVKTRGIYPIVDPINDVNNSQDYGTVSGFNFNPKSVDFTLLAFQRFVHTGSDMPYNMTLFAQQDGSFSGGGKGYLVSNIVGGQFSSALVGNWLTGINPIRNIWLPVVLRKTGASPAATLDLFYQGSKRATTSGRTIPDMNGDFRVAGGKDDPALGHGTRCFEGSTGPIVFMGRAMTDQEIFAWMNSGQLDRTSLIFEYLMATNPVNGPQDTGPNNYNFQFHANATWEDLSPITPAPIRNIAINRLNRV